MTSRLFSLFLLVVLLSSCGTFGRKLKSFMAGGEEAPVAQNNSSGGPKFSNTANLPADQKRRLYRRTTRESFEREGMLQENAGSLWVMEGQGSYLFSQNIIRVVGDLVNVEIEGGPKTQLVAKVDVIKRLIEKSRRDAKREIASREAAEKAQNQQANPTAEKPKEPGKDGEKKDVAGGGDGKLDGEKDDNEDGANFDVGVVPARIVEKSPDGSYRVKGSQQFMIGKKEYKVIVTGMVRSSDIDNDVIQSSKILDSRFDIVSTKKEFR